MLKQLFKKYFSENQLVRRTTGLLSIDILQKASNFLLLPFFLRFMSQEEYGLYGYLVAIVTVLSSHLIINLHLVQGKLFYEYEGKARGRLLFTASGSLILILTFILLPLYMFNLDDDLIRLMIRNEFDYEKYRWAILPALYYAAFSLMLNNYMLISEKIKLFQLYNLARLIAINPGSLLVLLLLSYDTVWLRFIWTYGWEVILVILFAIPYFKDMHFKWDKGIATRLKALCSPFVISSIISMLFQLSDRFVLDKYRNLSDMGIYNLGITIASVIYMINVSVTNAYLPTFFKEQDLKVNYKKTTRVSLRLFGIYSLFACFLYGLTFFLIRYNVIADSYEQVLFVLPWLLLGQIILALNSVYGYFLLYIEKINFGVFVSSAGNLFTIALYFIFVPVYGFLGIAISMMVSGGLMLGANIWFSKLFIKKGT
ncbi:MAG: oligosaccharide flippase family protein [Bacteroidia bacterium]|nr:oligosaccharide flippase family protein [Bacteroidia bacterium]